MGRKKRKNGRRRKGSTSSDEARISLIAPSVNCLGPGTNVEMVSLLFIPCSFSCISTCASLKYERFRSYFCFFSFFFISGYESSSLPSRLLRICAARICRQKRKSRLPDGQDVLPGRGWTFYILLPGLQCFFLASLFDFFFRWLRLLDNKTIEQSE